MAEWFRALDFNSIAPDSNPTLATSWRCFSVVGVQLIDSSAMLVQSQLTGLPPAS